MENDINKKYGIDENLSKYIAMENDINSKEFVEDLKKYIDDNGTLIEFNTSEENLIRYYYNYILNHPDTWIVISSINSPTDENSINLLFKIIDKFKENSINFTRRHNKLKININE